MNPVLIGIVVVIVLPMFVLAFFLLRGKGASLISGYSTLSKAEREGYDEKALCRFVGWLLIAVNIAVIAIVLGSHFEIFWLVYLSAGLILVGLLGSVFYAHTGNRFCKKGDLRDEERVQTREPMPKAQKRILGAAAIVGGLTLAGVVLLFYFGERQPRVVLYSEGLQIQAMYGVRVDFAEVAAIELLDVSMREIGAGTRTNGFGGRAWKGHFAAGLLFVTPDSAPTIRIERVGSADIYLSFADSAKTQALHRELLDGLVAYIPSILPLFPASH